MMKKHIYKFLGFLLALFAGSSLMANNIAISNLSLTGKNTTGHFTLVQFDISWENSWRTTSSPGNWDAAWVFVKYRVGGGDWQHAWLNESGHTAPAGSTITPGLLTPGTAFNATTNPGLGAFLYRSVDGTGTFTNTGVKLRWNYGANGLTDADADVVEIRAFAIEMVYVPQGSFYVGSGGTESGSLTNGSRTSGATVPLLISSENELTIAQTVGNLWGTSNTGYNTIGGAGTLAAAFPKGYDAFYCMKYEMSQQQYVDFLNTITSTQASNRYSSGSTGYRYGISVSGGVYSTTNPYVACNWLSWMDGAAYTDWAGLRPMTELEFEKACRGTATPVAGEYAWGNITATQANNIINGGANNETTNTPNANAVYLFPSGPMRTGVFATGSTTREKAGATFYGIMEMTGNLWERPVTIGSAKGRDFTGVHGNGTLSTAGYADISTWPGFVTTEVTTATGSGLRGGSFTDNYMNISNRELGSLEWSDRFQNDGFRAVRTQPPFICGVSTLTINHVTSGGVAPVDKTVTYGTVSTSLFGGTKCVITQNLGSTNQASSATDATEASAGWYWQFNRKQGYKMADDGTTRIPGSDWNATPDNSSATWEAAKDPCTIELGNGWRLPTLIEWTAADESWNNYNDTYTSVLKLHTAGYLNNDGSLYHRGISPYGMYCSSVQNDAPTSWNIFFNLNDSYPSWGTKADGHSARCVKDLLPTSTTKAVTGTTSSTASSGGNVTDDGGSTITARGICWSTTTGPTTALTTKTTETGTTGEFTSNLTGLNASTLYYVRAYATNSAGTAYGDEVSFTTAAPFVCGTSSLSINHVTTGGVAPVNKTVSYGTVSTTLFGGTKCAITQNLGASQQASSVNDATEASAGWYWQFNRKQGYKHDGTTRTPNSVWDGADYTVYSSWEAVNDPCTLELGTGWRIPTFTEWTAADALWNNYNDTYASVLKLHAAGYLTYNGGSLYIRGTNGYYWTSTESSANTASDAFFSNMNSWVGSGSLKAYAFSVRCLKDLLPTLTTTDATVITNTTATSGGNVTNDGGNTITARGICWSTTTAPTTDLNTKTTETGTTGVFTSNLNSLTANTLYYVRSYATTSVGTAYGTEVSFTTTGPPFVCGTATITKNHLASGGVAPVDKTVIYNTVKNIPGETSKCWITSNLGADHQATAVNDATEASAGWYWQFNRKQGFKHDGTTRTPSTTWDETFDNSSATWEAAKDPCKLELGSAWHIPTNTEWNNVYNAGSWATWADPWDSGLKLHAAGELDYVYGWLSKRGSFGNYWSNTEVIYTKGWSLRFNNGFCTVDYNFKTTGYSIRCLRDLLPTLTTTNASAVKATTATSGSTITDQGGSNVTARGVCWSTSASPTTALTTKTIDGTGTGTFSSSLTGLTESTLYYVRAYATNSDGTVYGNEVSFTTAAFVCGTSTITKNHLASGGVAPVDKSVSYGTVSTTLFGGTKCAITQNLGATNQASFATDDTEASAGWYWQFNRKQGYKADCANGTTCFIPSSPAWNTDPDNTSATWEAAKDPCTLELGTGWRLPTYTEWVSADGSWANMNDAWSSMLKLHAAGYLRDSGGSLTNRGSNGNYWSSTQSDASNGRFLYFYSGGSLMHNDIKSYGCTIRCLKD